MTLLVACSRAWRRAKAIEVGTFTGYSSICIAHGLPGERPIALPGRKRGRWTSIARKYWKRAGVDKKIELRLGPGVESMEKLERGRQVWMISAFIDADKARLR